MFACLHETIHNTAFKTPWLNDAAAFLAGILHIYPSVMIRELHFTHHRYTHIPGKDPEISFGNKPMKSIVSSLPFYLTWLSGLPLFMFKNFMAISGALGMPEPIRRIAFPFVRPEVRLKLFANSLVVVSVQVAIVLAAIHINPGFWGLFVGQVIGHCFLASYTAPEHNGLPHEGNILERTRSIKASKIVNYIMWNMPYHAEHHAYPAVPFYALPELHEIISDEITHKDKSHPTFHWLVFKQNILGNTKID
jgi:fatty acid desaturase